MTIDLDGQAQDLRQSEVAKLKEWLRFNRKASGVTRANLAKRVRVMSPDVFRWESQSSCELPTQSQLLAAAAAMGVLPPVVPDGLLPEEIMGEPVALAKQSDPAWNFGNAVVLEPLPGELNTAAELKRWLRRVRKQANLTQSALAARLGLHMVTVHKWEHLGEVVLPPEDRLEQIAKHGGVELPKLAPDLVRLRQSGSANLIDEPLPPPALTLLGEIEQVAQRLSQRYRGQNTQARNAALFVDYYARGHTLQVVGDAHGLTRERVRQVVARLVEVIPRLTLPHTRFSELVARCQALGAMTVEAAESELADLLGGVSISSAQAYGANVLGIGLPVLLDTDAAVPMLMPRDQPNWLPAALRHARKFIRFNGAALFDQIWAATQTGQDAPVEPGALRTALQSVYGFTWLDPTEQWFWFGPADGANRMLDWARRILATAERRVDIEHLHAGISRFTVLYDETSPITPVLPTAQVLLLMLASCPDIEVKQRDDLKLLDHGLVPDVEPGTVIDRVLTLLRSHGGVMARSDLAAELVDNQGVVPISMSVQLASSPLIRRMDHGVYAIRGWHLSPDSVTRAWQSNQSKSVTAMTYLPEGGLAWDATLTRAVVANDRLYLPQSVCRALTPGLLHLPDGDSLSIVGSSEFLQLRGLPRVGFAMGGEEGDRFRITIWPDRRACSVEPA